MELMQTKLSVCCPKRFVGSNVFCVQLAYAAANAPRLDADTCITQATAETLKVPGSAIKLRLPTSTSALFTLSVSFRWLCSYEKIFHLVDGELSKLRDLVTVSSLMRSLSSTTWCLRDLGEPIHLKSPRQGRCC